MDVDIFPGGMIVVAKPTMHPMQGQQTYVPNPEPIGLSRPLQDSFPSDPGVWGHDGAKWRDTFYGVSPAA